MPEIVFRYLLTLAFYSTVAVCQLPVFWFYCLWSVQCVLLCQCVYIADMLWSDVAAPVTGVTSSDELVSLSTPEVSLPVSGLHLCSTSLFLPVFVLIYNIELYSFLVDHQILDGRLYPQCAIHNVYLLIFIADIIWLVPMQ